MKHALNTDRDKFLIEGGEKSGVWELVAGPEAGVPPKTREARLGGKRRYASCAFTALSGCRVGEWTGFSHLETALPRLFPHDSTQVVDFPHIEHVNQAELGANLGKPKRTTEAQSQAEFGSKLGKPARTYAGKSADYCAMFREGPRKFAQIRPVIPRLFGFLRVRAFFR
jgi:hypothetical protein